MDNCASSIPRELLSLVMDEITIDRIGLPSLRQISIGEFALVGMGGYSFALVLRGS